MLAPFPYEIMARGTEIVTHVGSFNYNTPQRGSKWMKGYMLYCIVQHYQV